MRYAIKVGVAGGGSYQASQTGVGSDDQRC